MEKQLVLSLFILFYATISLADPEVTTVQSINGPMTKTVAQGAVTYCFVSHAGMIRRAEITRAADGTMTYDQDVFRYTRDGGFCFEDPATRYMKKGELEARFAQMERQFNFVVAQAKEAIAR